MVGYNVTKDSYELVPGKNEFGDFTVMGYSPTKSCVSLIQGISAKFHAQPAPDHLATMGGVEGERFGAWGEEFFNKEEFDFGSEISGLTGMKGSGVKYTPKHDLVVPNGLSYIESSPVNGLSMFNHTGPDPATGELAFLQIKRYSSNPNNIGLYFGTPTVDYGMKPFAREMKTLIIKSRQELRHASFPEGSEGMQKVGACVLHNAFDPRVNGDPDIKISRIALSPNSFNSNENVPNSPALRVDPDQGGQPFIGGGFAGGGMDSIINSQYMTHACWTTYGSSTQRGTFSIRTFTITMTWAQFKNTLRHATYKAGLNGSRTSDVESVFGKSCFTAKNWELKNVKPMGQEISNPNYETISASMGGRVKYVTMQAV